MCLFIYIYLSLYLCIYLSMCLSRIYICKYLCILLHDDLLIYVSISTKKIYTHICTFATISTSI